MIEEIEGRPEGTLEFRISGSVTGGDYDEVLTPAIDRALEEHDRIRLLCQVGPDFERYSLGAAWDDMRLGLRHWSGFERMALATDVGWMATMVRALGFAMPCPIRVFEHDELDVARRWLSESLGTIHLHEQGDGTLTVELIGKLDASVYDRAARDLDDFVARNGRFNLLLDLRQFDGWQGLGALGEHFSLVRDHRHAPRRVAVIGDSGWKRLAKRIFSRFVDAEVRYFDPAAAAEATSWIAAPMDAEATAGQGA